MSGFNGLGQFFFTYNWVQDSQNAIPITASRMDTQFNDAAQGFDNCVTRDGQSPATANIPLGGFKLTGLGAPTLAGDALSYGTGTNASTLLVPTRQVFLSGSAATYTTPAGCRQIRIRMVGGGGGGGGYNGGGPGSAGGDTLFNSIVARRGGGGGGGSSAPTFGSGGAGGTGGAGTASFRQGGQSGVSGIYSTGAITMGDGAPGGNSLLGAGSTVSGSAAQANSGGGGCGQPSSTANNGGGGGGGGGEYVEIIISSPAATYVYTIGASGAGATSASAGGTGIIIVDEFY